jgi:hypothetical protein
MIIKVPKNIREEEKKKNSQSVSMSFLNENA